MTEGSYRVDCEACEETISAAARFCSRCGTEQQRAVEAIERMRSDTDHGSLLDHAEHLCNRLADDESLTPTARVECLLALRCVEAATSETILSGHGRKFIVSADEHLFRADAEADDETLSTIRDVRQLLWGAVDLRDRSDAQFVKRGGIWRCASCFHKVIGATPHGHCPNCSTQEDHHVS